MLWLDHRSLDHCVFRGTTCAWRAPPPPLDGDFNLWDEDILYHPLSVKRTCILRGLFVMVLRDDSRAWVLAERSDILKTDRRTSHARRRSPWRLQRHQFLRRVKIVAEQPEAGLPGDFRRENSCRTHLLHCGPGKVLVRKLLSTNPSLVRHRKLFTEFGDFLADSFEGGRVGFSDQGGV